MDTDIKDRYISDPYPIDKAVEHLLSLPHPFPLSFGEGRGEAGFLIQFNPARITSSSAKIDADSIRERKCFLCPENLLPWQKAIPFKGRYAILANPFPIFPKHLTIPTIAHTPQRIVPPFPLSFGEGRSEAVGDMLTLAFELNNFIILYNGPKCGASAPDHMHFQAGSKGVMPIEKEWRNKVTGKVTEYGDAVLWSLEAIPCPTLVIESGQMEHAIALFNTVCMCMELKPDDDEPRMNVLAWYEENKWIVCIFPREKHRPSCYTAEGEKNMLISPGSADMGGLFITPRKEDFEKITAEDIIGILSEVCISPEKFGKLIERVKKT